MQRNRLFPHRLLANARATGLAIAAFAAGLAALGGLTGYEASAQQVQRIAAVVNDEVISVYDVTQRIDFIIASSRLPKTPETQRRLAPQVLRRLIDEHLEEQEAKRLNIHVTQHDLDAAISHIEQSNGIPKGQFDTFLRQQGVSKSAVMQQIKANIAWQKVLARRVVPKVEIGEEEVDAVIARINATKGAEQYRVSEILLTVDDPNDQAQVRELASKLVEQIRGGADFAAVARQFSKSATAATGGDIGWVQEGQLDQSVINVLKKLTPGSVSDPVKTPDGLVIYRLDDKRKSAAPGEDDREIALRQILVQTDKSSSDADIATRMQQVGEVTGSAKGCPAFVDAAKQLGVSQPAKPTRIRAGDLNEKLRGIVDKLAVGTPSAPLRTPVGIQVVMVCERSDLAGPPRDQIRETLMRNRIDLRARRYLRDLRRAAFVDIRV